MSDVTQVQFHISPKPIGPGDTGPQVILGFSSVAFSQAVFLDAPVNAGDAVQVADALYKGFLESAGAAVKAWKDAQENTVKGIADGESKS